uniref:Endonuclease n=1 Tax=Parasitella parasitica TaxID=35722 RepID=A0A088SQH5_9FUNG|nr:endonuclease [Parasitella parasitica]AIO05730.1 endonuclease [Parasitella parasitica]
MRMIWSYLTGLLESNGHINIRYNKDLNKVISLAYDFTFNKNNIILYEELKIFIYFGNIYKKYNYTMLHVVSNLEGLGGGVCPTLTRWPGRLVRPGSY